MAQLALAVARPAPAAIASYGKRAAFRATPHGLWAGCGMGQLGARTKAKTGPMRASVTVAYARLWAFAREALDDAGTRQTARLRVAPSLLCDATTAMWLAFGDDTESMGRAAEIDEVLGLILDAAIDWIPWGALRDSAGVDDEFVLMLVDHGLLVHDGAPPLVGPPPLLWMAARHPEWGEVAAQLATPTAASIAALAEPLHAVLVHEGSVTLSEAAVTRAASLAPLLFRIQEALSPPAAERALDAGAAAALVAAEEIFGAGAYDLDALALGGYGTPLDVEIASPVAPPADVAVARVVLDAIVAALTAGDGEARLDVAALDAVAPPFAVPPSFELNLAPMRERGGAAPGDGWLLGLHAPAGSTWGRFAHALGAPLLEAMAPLADGAVDVDYAPSARLGDLCAHPPLRARTLALSSWPDAEALTPSELLLAAAGPQTLDGTVTPSPLWRVRSTTAPRGPYRQLIAHSLVRQHAPWALSLGRLADLAHVPRLTLDGFVVAPASWRIPPLASTAALRRWRKAMKLPRHLQVGHEDELMLVDLEAPGALETLRRQPDARAFEVWPPLDAGIDAGGRRLEAIIAVVDDEAEPRPPLGRVPPPSETPAAAGWHTWKLFGAADRADRVLQAVIAPAIAAARAAGEIDGWFFLRYVDGPGHRDHLRLRVHAADAALFNTRLLSSLDPARAAGDVVTVERADYHREVARYGADAIAAVERIFEADSDLVVQSFEDDGDPVELCAAAYDALAAGAGLDPDARHALARRRREAYGVGKDPALADGYRARQAALRARFSKPTPPFATYAERVTTLLAPLSAARRAQLLPPLLHLAAVRMLGIDRAREAAAFYLWERTRESLLRHRER
ncbi:MAG: Lanthionine biosynthesis protein LanB [Myxococcales bacterium]|nr:Lanthionine biosynthesis protein LanB [Myxococcales bacterium]